MKRITGILIILCLYMVVNTANAQAWDKSTKVLAFGIGGSQFFHIDDDYNRYYKYRYGYYGRRFPYAPTTGQFNFQGEFGVHDYVGVGFTVGVGGGTGWGRFGSVSYYDGELTVPVGAIANFHFYQLIADKTGGNLHADKLDVYAGVNIGSGVAILFDSYYATNDQIKAVPIVFGGVQVGARYYFTDKFGVNLEVGYGKSLVNGGIVLKL